MSQATTHTERMAVRIARDDPLRKSVKRSGGGRSRRGHTPLFHSKTPSPPEILLLARKEPRGLADVLALLCANGYKEIIKKVLLVSDVEAGPMESGVSAARVGPDCNSLLSQRESSLPRKVWGWEGKEKTHNG